MKTEVENLNEMIKRLRGQESEETSRLRSEHEKIVHGKPNTISLFDKDSRKK